MMMRLSPTALAALVCCAAVYGASCARDSLTGAEAPARTIAVIGSSTAAGTGASSPDSSWVGRYRRALAASGRGDTVVNLARGGYTTFQLVPAGAAVSDRLDVAADTARNISAALRREPDVVIVNLPSNDAANGVTVATQLAHFAIIDSVGRAAGAEVFFATTQPRNFEDDGKVDAQEAVRDSLRARYGERAIDFWSDLAGPRGHLRADVDAGDGVHVGNRGHRRLFRRVWEAVE